MNPTNIRRPDLIAVSAAEVRALREEKQWSMARAALYTGISRSCWGYYEKRGIRNAIICDRFRRLANS